MSQPYSKQQPNTIQKLFNAIAPSYDRTNGILSFQLHKLWNRKLIQMTFNPQDPGPFLDLCCGTGAIGLGHLAKTDTPTKAYLLDFSEGMLEEAKRQASHLQLERHDIAYVQADAQAIPLPNASVKCATIAYGIRNVQSPRACIQEAFRVLCPGGTFAILELTQPSNPLLRALHKTYLNHLLPLLGKLSTQNKEAYQYLSSSIKSFTPPQELQLLLYQAGFKQVTLTPLWGGIATILQGTKPS